MGLFSGLLFETPLALWALLTLPAIWWLLRTTPPRPREQAFPPLRILMQLRQTEDTPDKMPWWLLLLRLALAALLILAVAHPFLRHGQALSSRQGPLLMVIDDGWAAAADWPQRQEAAGRLLEEAQGRIVYLAGTSVAQAPVGENTADAQKHLRAWKPAALPSDRMQLLPALSKLDPKPAEIIWLADNLDTQSSSAFATGLGALAEVKVVDVPGHKPPLALGKPSLAGGEVAITALRAPAAPTTATVQAIASNGRLLAETQVDFGATTQKQVRVSLPVELRNEISSLKLKNENQAAARTLLDDTWKRKTVGIETGGNEGADQPLLAPPHYLEAALASGAETTSIQSASDLTAALDAGLSMLVLSDIGTLPQPDHDAIATWLDKGGLLVRFAGPHMAAATDDLVPVKLREGDRNLGASLSWETPQAIKPFADQSPLTGLAIAPEAKVSRQLLAEPDADLSGKTWASLEDGTPLITSAPHGKGRIVLFHVTANADWSNLPLTGTFATVMQRILQLAPAAGSVSQATAAATASPPQGGDFAARLVLNGTGELENPSADIKPLSARAMASASATPATPAGYYTRPGENRAINVQVTAADLAPMPAALNVTPLTAGEIQNFAPWLFGLAAVLFLADCLAALFVGGHLRRAPPAIVLLLGLLLPWASPEPARAATADEQTMQAALQTHLAYVKTGDTEIDLASAQGLKGLGLIMANRTSAALGDPRAIDIESDEIVFYPLLYWPVTADAQAPGPAALTRISAYMKNGGTIFFDLRDNAANPSSGPTGEALRRILGKLDVPPLETVPDGHALTKSFYLLKNFPGRYEGAPLWVEAQDDPSSSGFDNVSGIIIGANDYAAAWALDDQGRPLYAVIPGSDQQQEMAMRVGVNLVMYVLTGNYKTDQVHIPAILERLNQQ